MSDIENSVNNEEHKEESEDNSDFDSNKRGNSLFTKYNFGITELPTKLGLSKTKFLTFVGAIFTLLDSFILFRAGITTLRIYSTLMGGIGLLLGVFLLFTLITNEVSLFKKFKLPYTWFIIMGSGLFLFIFFLLGSVGIFGGLGGYGFLRGALVLLVSGIILLFKGLNKSFFTEMQILYIVGIGLGIFESIRIFTVWGFRGFWYAWIPAILIVISLVYEFFTLNIVKITIPRKFMLGFLADIVVLVILLNFGSGIAWIFIFMGFLFKLIEE